MSLASGPAYLSEAMLESAAVLGRVWVDVLCSEVLPGALGRLL